MQCVTWLYIPCGYWTSGTLSALVSNRNTLYNVMGVKRHIIPVDLPQSVSISGAEINVTFRAVSTCVLRCNLAESRGPARGGSHVARLNFKTSRVGVMLHVAVGN